jgi:hypothetical protein
VPVNLPLGLGFTDVTTEPGCLLLAFAGRDVQFTRSEPTTGPTPKPAPGARPNPEVDPPAATG